MKSFFEYINQNPMQMQMQPQVQNPLQTKGPLNQRTPNQPNPNQNTQNPNQQGAMNKLHPTKNPGLFIMQTQNGFYPMDAKNQPVRLMGQQGNNINWFPNMDDALRAGQSRQDHRMNGQMTQRPGM